MSFLEWKNGKGMYRERKVQACTCILQQKAPFLESEIGKKKRKNLLRNESSPHDDGKGRESFEDCDSGESNRRVER